MPSACRPSAARSASTAATTATSSSTRWRSGVARADAIFYAKATGVGNPIVYLGSKTGRDGIHGATMASAAFEADAEEKRPTVQVGDPFAEKLLLEACLELMASGAVVAIQDMGAAGLTSSAVEMGAKGDLGVELDLDQRPLPRNRHDRLRDDAVGEPGADADGAAAGKAARRRGDLPQMGAGIRGDRPAHGHKRFVVKRDGEVKADLPIKELGDEAPLYDRPWVPTPPRPALTAEELLGARDPLRPRLQRGAPPRPGRASARDLGRGEGRSAPVSINDALLTLLASPNLGSKRWVYEQYDSLILGNTVQGPGGDAAVIRLGDGPKGLALTDRRQRALLRGRPVEGGKQAVAEAWRNLIAVGAKPLALTDNLNFGNPEKPEAMGELVGCIRGIGEAARALDFPVVSGNVSLYNETMGRGILPTPVDRRRRARRRRDQDRLDRLQGGGRGDSADRRRARRGSAARASRRSASGARTARRRRSILPPSGATASSSSALIAEARVSAVHDVSDGGLAVALAEMAMAGGIGAQIAMPARIAAAWAVRRGSGALCRLGRAPDEASRIVAEARARRRSGRAHRRHRRRGADLRRRGADSRSRRCGARTNRSCPSLMDGHS